MESPPDEQIDEYIETHLSPELSDEINASFILFDAFEYQNPYVKMLDVLNDLSNEDSEITQREFLEVFSTGLDELLQAHQVVVFPETDLSTKNQILAVLYRLQKLEDPIPVLKILESDKSDEEKLAAIIDQYSLLSEGEVLSAVESIQPSSLQVLQTYLYGQEKSEEEPKTNEEIQKSDLLIKNLRDYIHIAGEGSLAEEMMVNGINPGKNFDLYYPFIASLIENPDDGVIAKNILSAFFMSSNTFSEPLKAYRAFSEKLVHDSARIPKIEIKISGLLEDLRNYQKVTHEARSLSPIQHQA